MLTRSQVKTLDFIKAYVAEHNYAPTTAEIAAGIGIVSRGVVYRYLKALVAANKITLLPHRRRNILLTNTQQQGLPLLGKIAAGAPIEAVTDPEMIDVTRIFLGEDRFALRICGDSMIDEGILDGDLVVCERAQQAKSGQIVVALVDSSQATLKRIAFPKQDVVQLLPANADYLPQEYKADRVQIQGLYVGLLRIPA